VSHQLSQTRHVTRHQLVRPNMKRTSFLCAALILIEGTTVMAADRIEPNAATGISAAVVAGSSLVHTVQFLPTRDALSSKDVGQQLADVLKQAHSALRTCAAGDLVKLNLYVASNSVAADVFALLPTHFPDGKQPAVSLVVTSLPDSAALLACDVVAEHSSAGTETVQPFEFGTVIPPGSRIYISGQAEQSESLAEATTKTLDSLRRTLTFLGRGDKDIAQLKAFVQPMSDFQIVRDAVARFYAGQNVPPLVLVEWKSSRTTPIEIELVAWGGAPAADTETMEFLTPPGMTASPIYCRVCRVNAPQAIFISGRNPVIKGDSLSAEAQGDAEVLEVFSSLDRILTLTGSNFQHLAKATYYVSTDAASASLNKLRPNYYDPARPPAASKAMVAGVGRTGSGLNVDMIAVPIKTDSR
jgi:enamine deaminase RidA (YjgF/YER057c/UK114 family)